VVGLLATLVLVAAGCGGDDGGGSTGATGTGATGAGATGASGSASVARFAVVVQDVDGGNTLSFSGVSCDGLGGPYDVTIAVAGNATGTSTATFTFDDGGTARMQWSLNATGAAGEATVSGDYRVEMSPLQDSQVIVFTGPTSVEEPDGSRSFNVTTDDVPVAEGTGTCDQSG
jgi:hypothetical protein